jgi:hypothetical protein
MKHPHPTAGRRWHAPADPACPVLAAALAALWSDPMTACSGCGDEIAADVERDHRLHCDRCQEYGAENVEIR